MEKAVGEDETVEARETAAPPIAGAPATKRKEGAGAIDVGASGAAICDDVLSNILARLPARTAVASMVLSKHHLALICSPEFRSLHCRLGPPLPSPLIAFIATTPIKRRPDHEVPVSMFHGFHVLGAGLVGNAPMRAIAGTRYLDAKYLNTGNGIVLLASKEFSDGQCTCTLWNPAVSDHAKEVTVPDSSLDGDVRVLALGYGRRSGTYKILLCCKEYGKRGVKYPLLIYELGNAEKQPLLLTTVSMELKEEIDDMSLYMNGTIYLHFGKSVILAFDVDDETVSTIDLPGKGQEVDHWDTEPQLLEISGRPCVAANHDHRRALWILTVEHQWEQRCVIAKNSMDVLYYRPVIGVWDCRDMLVLLFGDDMLCVYHVPTTKMFMVELPTVQRARKALCRRLGIIDEEEEATLQQALADYIAMFKVPLPPSIIAALTATFDLDNEQVAHLDAGLLQMAGQGAPDIHGDEGGEVA